VQAGAALKQRLGHARVVFQMQRGDKSCRHQAGFGHTGILLQAVDLGVAVADSGGQLALCQALALS
jgi:hypothetical protein